MEELLAKFRIEYSELILIHAITEEPNIDSWSFWRDIVDNTENINIDGKFQNYPNDTLNF